MADHILKHVIGLTSVSNASLPSPGNGLGSNNGAGFGWRDVATFKLGLGYALNEQLTFGSY